MAHILQTSFIPSTSSLRRTSISGSKGKSQSLQVKAKIREIFMPALSSTMTEDKIVSWMKSEGDKLSKRESVVVVESDKADMDVESFHEGFLVAILVEEGGVTPVGSAITLLAETEDGIAKAKAKSQSSSNSSAQVVEEKPKRKKDVAPAAPVAPIVLTTKIVAVGSAVHPASERGKRIVASPYAKKLAKEFKVDLGIVVGTGPMGRIVAKDVESAAAAGVVAVSDHASLPASPAEAAPVAPGIELGTVVPFTTMQGAVSRNMIESLSVPTFRVCIF